MFEYFITLSRVYKIYIFLSLNILFGQFSSNVIHVDIISNSEKVEVSIIFDEIIDRDDVSSGGYVKETFQAAWWAYQTTDSFENCIIEAINLGDDADTVGAVAGMIAGRMYGFDAIPKWMVEGVQWSEHLIDVSKKLVLLN